MTRWWIVVLAACGSPDPAAKLDGPPGDDDAPNDASIDAGLPTWESVETISDDGTVIVERVSYRSDGFKIYAQQCRPKAAGQYTILVYNHGGFQGLAVDPEAQRCTTTAQLGYVWLGSSYRGEEGSEGQIEVCLGEVTDVLSMIDIGRVQPYANGKVLMYGASHGGCITQRAVQRGAPVRAAVDVFGPTNWSTLYAFWQAPPQNRQGIYAQVSQVLEMATGGTPSTKPDEYAKRSPGNFVADIPATTPLLVAQGTDDLLVPPVQSCNLAMPAMLVSWHVTAAGAELATTPAGCEGTGVPSMTTARPQPSWPGTRYLVVYDGLAHETSSAAAQVMLQDAATFLMAKQ